MPRHQASLFHEGWLPVEGKHHLYYAEYGVPEGSAVLVLHGGPGSGCQPSMLDWFDLAQQRVVLFDQRGAGRSLPHGEMSHNHTAALVEDIECLRQHLRISRWVVVGGSWGATLALCYAGRYPHAIDGLVLRGVFLASRREIDWFFQSLRVLVPQAWGRLTAGWTAPQKASVFPSLAAMLHSGSPYEQQDAAQRWGQYEENVMRAMLGQPGTATAVNENWLGKYRLQAHYLSHGCFICERSLFRCARTVSHIPTIILHGTHDWVCPPENALRLIRFMPHAELRWIGKGTHTPADPAIATALQEAVRDIHRMVHSR